MISPAPPANTRLQPAVIDWQGTVPYSRDYDDVYFSAEDGLAESRHVFLRGNGLPHRWQAAGDFVIAETGFGSGLNLLLTGHTWLETTESAATLHYISVEQHPLTETDLARTLAQLTTQWPQLDTAAQALLDHYPPPVAGFHHRTLFDGRIRLTLIFAAAHHALQQLQARVDAWYLDGFAPAKNPAMWHPELLCSIARLSAPGASFATFTAAGQVRRDLQQAGFAVSRRPGFGRKREMLSGTLASPPPAPSRAPWFMPAPAAPEKQAIVIGGGIAGCTSAWNLARRGWRVTLLEQGRIAGAASGNPAGIVMPNLGAQWSPEAEFSLHAFLHARAVLDELPGSLAQPFWYPEGVVQLMPDAQRDRVIASSALPATLLAALDRQQAAASCGLATSSGGLLFPGAGWLTPAPLCNALLEMAETNIQTRTSCQVQGLERRSDHWRVITSSGETLQARTVILANAGAATRLLPGQELPLQRVRGQLAYLDADPTSGALRRPLCGDGYVLPALHGQHCIGATFDREDDDTTLRAADQRKLLAQARSQSGWPATAVPPPLRGRVAFRCATPDHLPVVGPVADPDFYQTAYRDLHRGHPPHRCPPARYLPGLYLNTGHGSRGLTSAWLCAELLAALLDGTPLPLARNLAQRLHPARFLVRTLKRAR